VAKVPPQMGILTFSIYVVPSYFVQLYVMPHTLCSDPTFIYFFKNFRDFKLKKFIDFVQIEWNRSRQVLIEIYL